MKVNNLSKSKKKKILNWLGCKQEKISCKQFIKIHFHPLEAVICTMEAISSIIEITAIHTVFGAKTDFFLFDSMEMVMS